MLVSGHPTLEEAQIVGERVKQAIAPRFSISHSTLELECEPCLDEIDEFCEIELPVTGAK